MPTPRRSVSQIAADLEALAQPDDSISTSASNLATPPTSTSSSTQGKDEEKEKGSRRVTMPPIYSQPGGPLSKEGANALPAVQPRRASIQVKPVSATGGIDEYPFPGPDKGVASPTPKRPARLTSMGFELGSR
jgi:hypothetical protein